MQRATVSGAVCAVAQEMGASMRSPATNLTGVALIPRRREAVRRLGAMRFGVTFLAVILRAVPFLEGAMRLAGVIRLGAIFLAAVLEGAALRLGAMRFAEILRAEGLAEAFFCAGR